MEQVIRLLNNCWLNYLGQDWQKTINYLSPIQGEEPGWYIWLHNCPGVYELQLLEWKTVNEKESSSFLLKYYPSLEEEAFDRLSFKEQVTRLSEYFDNTPIKKVFTKNCPCSSLSTNHQQSQPLIKGIPRWFHRKNINSTLFTIGEIKFKIIHERLLEITLTSQDHLRLCTLPGITVKQGENITELVPPGGVDRDFPGWTTSWHFFDIFVKEILGKMGCYSSDCNREVSQGVVCFEGKGGEIWEKEEPGVTRIAHTFYF